MTWEAEMNQTKASKFFTTFSALSAFLGFLEPFSQAAVQERSDLSGAMMGRFVCTLPEDRSGVILLMDLFQDEAGKDGVTLSGVSTGLDSENRRWIGLLEVSSVDGKKTPLESGVTIPETLKAKAAPSGESGDEDPGLQVETLSAARVREGTYGIKIKVLIRDGSGRQYRETYDSCRFITISEMIKYSKRN